MRRAIAAVVFLAPATAVAEPQDIKGAASLEYEASYVHALEDPMEPAVAPEAEGLGLAGIRGRAQAGGDVMGYRIGLDLHAGATAPAGFAYDVAFYPMGVGFKLGRWSRFGVVAGIGASGATGTMDDAAMFPVEASLELGLGSRLRLIARGRVSWLSGADTRDHGAPSLSTGDELDASVSLRLGKRSVEYDFPAGNGYYLGVGYREAEDTRMIGVVIGHSIDVGTQ